MEGISGTVMVEAPARATSAGLAGCGGDEPMVACQPRLVQRVHEQLRARPAERGGAVSPAELRELQARLERLRFLGGSYGDVRLSAAVAP